MAYEELTNLLPFGKDLYNAMGDAEYRTNGERLNGIIGALADRKLHNKVFAQSSSVAYALGQFIAGRGFEANDNDADGMSDNFIKALLSALKEEAKDLIPDARIPNHAYKKGDVINDFYMPLWSELECIEDGISSSGTLEGVVVNAIGQKIQDGTLTWALRAKKFQPLNGVPVPFSGNFIPMYATNTIVYWVPIHAGLQLPMIDCRFCDGQDLSAYGLGKTVDMRGLIRRGSKGKPDNDTGRCCSDFNVSDGADSVSLAKANLPVNSYRLDLSGSVSAGSHAHSYNASLLESTVHPHHMAETEGSRVGWLDYYTTMQQMSGGTGEHSHTASAAGNIQINASQTKISTIPKYYALAYIQRIY